MKSRARRRPDSPQRRVLLVSNRTELYGAERSLLEHARVFSRHEAEVVVPGDGPLADALRASAVPVHRVDVPATPKSFSLSDSDAKRLFARADLVHFNKVFQHANIDRLREIADDHGTRLVVSVRGRIGASETIRRWCDRVDGIVTVANHLARALTEAFDGAFAEKTFVMSAGRNFATYVEAGKDDADRRRRARADLGIPETAKVVALIGYFDPNKGQHLFVEMARHLVHESDTYFLLLGGALENTESYRRDVLRKIRSLRLEHRFRTPGFDVVWERLPGIDVVVSASESEGLPGALIEAMAAARPVVVPDTEWGRELISSEELGDRCPRTPEALAQCVRALLADGPRRRRLGDRARAHVTRLYSAGRSAEMVETIYDRLL